MTDIQTDNKKIKVLIADDSALVRKILSDELSKDKELEIVGTAPDPVIARNKIVLLEPDVLLLDVELPKINGLTFLKKIMKYYPMPVIIFSIDGKKGSKTSQKAFELGAFDVLEKPESAYEVGNMIDCLTDRIKAASLKRNFAKADPKKPAKTEYDSTIIGKSNKIIAIGASTGGTEAIREVLTGLPDHIAPTLIVQHMPQNFTKSFALRLDSLCGFKVKEAEDEEPATPDKVLIAPGNKHMVLRRDGTFYYVRIIDGPFVYHQRPSVEVLFQSVAEYAGRNAVGVILTGMGRDGAGGLLNMREAGAYTIAQDERSCVVYGMPKEAIELGAVMKTAPLDQIPRLIEKHMG